MRQLNRFYLKLRPTLEHIPA